MKMPVVISLIAATSWTALWFTPDQQGQRLMNREEYSSAAEAFRDPMRKGTAWFRAGEFEKAEQQFARVTTAEAEFNRGNCLIMRGKYDAAIERFDRALTLKPEWEAAEINRSIAVARAELTKQEGGDLGDQRIGADEIVFDRTKRNDEGQETRDEGGKISDAEMQAMWLRRVQTKPADFLRAKFAYQLADDTQDESTANQE